LTGGQSLGLLVLRFVVGAAFILHGWPKIQKPTSWMGDAVPGFLQFAAAVTEFGGGIALILGLLTPLVTLALAVQMAAAMMLVHIPKGHAFVGEESFELPLVYLVLFVALSAIGPGRYSLDALLWGRGRTDEATLGREPLRRPHAA
jgi:putative oxidoreductase